MAIQVFTEKSSGKFLEQRQGDRAVPLLWDGSSCGEGRCPGGWASSRHIFQEAVFVFPASCELVRHAGTESQLVEMITQQFIPNNDPYCCVCYKLGYSTVMFSGLIMSAFGLSSSLGKQFSCTINHLMWSVEQSPRVRIAIPARWEETGFPDERLAFSPLHARVQDFCLSFCRISFSGQVSPRSQSGQHQMSPSVGEGLSSQKGRSGQKGSTESLGQVVICWALGILKKNSTF